MRNRAFSIFKHSNPVIHKQLAPSKVEWCKFGRQKLMINNLESPFPSESSIETSYLIYSTVIYLMREENWLYIDAMAKIVLRYQNDASYVKIHCVQGIRASVLLLCFLHHSFLLVPRTTSSSCSTVTETRSPSPNSPLIKP